MKDNNKERRDWRVPLAIGGTLLGTLALGAAYNLGKRKAIKTIVKYSPENKQFIKDIDAKYKNRETEIKDIGKQGSINPIITLGDVSKQAALESNSTKPIKKSSVKASSKDKGKGYTPVRSNDAPRVLNRRYNRTLEEMNQGILNAYNMQPF